VWGVFQAGSNIKAVTALCLIKHNPSFSSQTQFIKKRLTRSVLRVSVMAASVYEM
jgi:hypothetical protein